MQARCASEGIRVANSPQPRDSRTRQETHNAPRQTLLLPSLISLSTTEFALLAFHLLDRTARLGLRAVLDDGDA